MARCDMMQVTLVFVCLTNLLLTLLQAMFSDAFLEGSARCVRFPGVSCVTFRALLHYLYTDTTPRVTPATAMPVIELANRCVTSTQTFTRLVLPRLVSLVEIAVIEQLTAIIDQVGSSLGNSSF